MSENKQYGIFVTGASGFVGRAVISKIFDNSQYSIHAAVRRDYFDFSAGVEQVQIGNLKPDTDWSAAVRDIDVILHLAARVHVMKDDAHDPLAEFRRVNVESTLNFARQAVEEGVKRFIYISSIKVNGEGTTQDRPFTADDEPVPIDPYGVSKYEAELGLLRLAKETGLEVVIIRPVLVYGPGVKANFLSMIHWLDKGVPLPFGAIHNKRSLVALDNLVDLIVTCIDHPAAANQTFLVSDGEDLSTTELLQRMAVALGKQARLLPVPAWLLKFGAALIGKRDLAQRLLGSLQVDISKTREVLNWSPPVSVDEALKKTAEDFLSREYR